MDLTSADISELFDRHAPELLRYFSRRTFDHQIAIDLVGETFAIVCEQRQRYHGDNLEQARPWLFGIANNLLNDFYRSGQIERRAMHKLQITRAVPDESEFERIDEFVGTKELRAAVAGAVRSLPPDHRKAIELRVIEQLDYEEIAAVLGVSEQAARARVSRALGKLRQALDDDQSKEAIRHA